MKTYKGKRLNGELIVMVSDGTNEYRLPNVGTHSPTGFECGYGGSGPADLAYSILADMDYPNVQRHYEELKWDVIAKLPRDRPWELSESQIQKWWKYEG